MKKLDKTKNFQTGKRTWKIKLEKAYFVFSIVSISVVAILGIFLAILLKNFINEIPERTRNTLLEKALGNQTFWSNVGLIVLVAISIFVVLIEIKLIIGLWKKYKSHVQEHNYNQHGQRRFATVDELHDTLEYKSLPQKEPYTGEGGVVLAWDREKDEVIVDTGTRHNMILAPTRGGKGEGFIIPTLHAYLRAYEFIPAKGEIEVDFFELLNNMKIQLKHELNILIDSINKKNEEILDIKKEEENIRGIDFKSLSEPAQVQVIRQEITDIEENIYNKLNVYGIAHLYNKNEIATIDFIDAVNFQTFTNEEKEKIILKMQEEKLDEKIITEEIERLKRTNVIQLKIRERNLDKYIAIVKYEDKTKLNQESIIVTDPKGELFEMTSEEFYKSGYNVQVLNVIDSYYSNRFNPLHLATILWKRGDFDGAETVIGSVAEQIYQGESDIWQKSAVATFKAVSLALLEDLGSSPKIEQKMTLFNVAAFLQNMSLVDPTSPEEKTRLETYFEEKDESAKSRVNFAVAQTSKGNTLASIMVSAITPLNVFLSEKVAKMMSGNDIDFEEIGFGERPTIVYILVPDFDSSLYSIVSLFISQIYYALSNKLSKVNTNKTPRKIVHMLDEFANIPKIPNFDKMTSVGAGKHFLYNVILQTYDQLNINYEKDAGTIEANCANHIYIMSNDNETPKKFSEKLGNYTAKKESYNGKAGEEKSITTTFEAVPIMTPDELGSLQQGETIVTRPLTRLSKDYKDMGSLPIGNLGKNRLKMRFEYLDLPGDNSVEFLFDKYQIPTPHREFNLKENMYLPYLDERNEDINKSNKERVIVNRKERQLIDTNLLKSVIKITSNAKELADKGVNFPELDLSKEMFEKKPEEYLSNLQVFLSDLQGKIEATQQLPSTISKYKEVGEIVKLSSFIIKHIERRIDFEGEREEIDKDIERIRFKTNKQNEEDTVESDDEVFEFDEAIFEEDFL